MRHLPKGIPLSDKGFNGHKQEHEQHFFQDSVWYIPGPKKKQHKLADLWLLINGKSKQYCGDDVNFYAKLKESCRYIGLSCARAYARSPDWAFSYQNRLTLVSLDGLESDRNMHFSLFSRFHIHTYI